MWAISATVKDLLNFPSMSSYLPTFYLNEGVQEITDEKHAERIAKDILNPTRNPLIQVFVTAVNVGSMCNETHVTKPDPPDYYMFRVKFRQSVWKYWTDDPEKTYMAIRCSLTGKSIWIWKDGQEKCVPVNCLLKQCNDCNDWILIGQYHHCVPLLKWERDCS